MPRAEGATIRPINWRTRRQRLETIETLHVTCRCMFETRVFAVVCSEDLR